jgi:hypothetical protein
MSGKSLLAMRCRQSRRVRPLFGSLEGLAQQADRISVIVGHAAVSLLQNIS